MDRVILVSTTYCPDTGEGVKRAAAAARARESWEANIIFDGQLDIHMADDGSELKGYYGESFPWYRGQMSWSRGERLGVGASLNRALSISFELSDIVFFIMDDMVLTRPLDITPWVDLLHRKSDIGIFRMGFPHPGLTGTVIFCPKNNQPIHYKEWALMLDKHDFAFSFRPMLMHKRFFDAYGRFMEGESSLETERKYNLHVCNTEGPGIAHAIEFPWYHDFSVTLSEAEP